MWIGNVRNLSFQDQLRATIAVDLNELSMTPLDFDRNLAKGLSARDMRMMAADAGVSLPILDPMASWAPRWRSGISDAAWMEFLGYSADDFFRIAEQLGVSTMTVIGTFQPGLVAIPETAESFALLADKARSHGLHCVLEFIPLWGIGDLASAWQILQIANRPNTGLAFDFWHYIRGGRDDALLRSIPGSKISYVQVTDAEASLPTGRSLFDDCLFHRLPPGQGGLPIKQLLDILCEIGRIERLGPEVFSAKLDASSAEEIGQALREPYWQALADSGIG
jgi:sugar phosphate isomerase/epimerase